MQIVITNAGLAALVNASATGTESVTVSRIGLGTGRYTPTKGQTALQSEFKQLNIVEGGTTGDNSLHVAVRDDSDDAYSIYEFGLYLADGTLFAVYSQNSVILQKVSTSQALLSVDVKLVGADAAQINFEGMTYSFAVATTSNAGIVELSTVEEVLAGKDTQRAVTPAGLAKLLATNSRSGLIRTATADEAKSGKDTTKAVTSLALKAAIDARAASDSVAAGCASETHFLTPKSVLAIEASTGRPGLVEFATEEETKEGSEEAKAVTPAAMKATLDASLVSATEEKAGIVRLATPDETKLGEEQMTAVSPFNMKMAIDERAASQEEIAVGTANRKFVTPLTIKPVIEDLLSKIEALKLRIEELEKPVAVTLKEPVKEENDGGV